MALVNAERTARLLDQLELTLEELESSATEDELAAEMAAAKTTKAASFTRKRLRYCTFDPPRHRHAAGIRKPSQTRTWALATAKSALPR
jgi:hypothetical protein